MITRRINPTGVRRGLDSIHGFSEHLLCCLVSPLTGRTLAFYSSGVQEVDKNGVRLDSTQNGPTRAAEVVKAFQVLRTKPRSYDDFESLKSLSIRTLENLPLFKASQLSDMCEIFAFLKYRNILLMHGVSEAFYWLCKLRKVKLRDLTRFLKSCFILRYVPNVRYLDLFFEEVDEVRHCKTVGDHLRMLQFLVHSNLCVSERYLRQYLRFYEHCTSHLGLMTHSHLSSFSQTQLQVDDADQEVFDRICLNFERGLGNSDVSHLKMLTNSLVRTRIAELPPAFPRVLKYYLRERRDAMEPALALDLLSLMSKFYYRDTECLNKLGLVMAGNIGRCTFNQVSASLNHFAALSYKHKGIIAAVSQLSLESQREDMFSKFSLMASLVNLIAKVGYNRIDCINALNGNCVRALEHVNGLISSGDLGDTPSNSLFYNQKVGPSGNYPKAIVTTDHFMDPEEVNGTATNSERPRRSILRKLRKRVNAVSAEKSLVESRLKYVPESTDIVKVQSISECFSKFYDTYFNGEHPAERRLQNRRSMMAQIRASLRGPEYEYSKALSKVYHEKKYEADFDHSMRRAKYKMRYASTRLLNPSTFYINKVKILKKAFLTPFVNLSSDLNDSGKYGLCNALLEASASVDRQSPTYVDTRPIVRPHCQPQKLRHRTKRELRKVLAMSNKGVPIVGYLTSNGMWSFESPPYQTTRVSILDKVNSIVDSLFRLNFLSYQLVRALSEGFLKKSFELALSEHALDPALDLSPFMGSVNRVLNALGPTFVADRSGSVLASFVDLISSDQFGALADVYLQSGHLSRKVALKLLGNLCKMSFFSTMKIYNLTVPDENQLSSLQTGDLKPFLSMTNKIISAVHGQGLVGEVSLEGPEGLDFLNNIVYLVWLRSMGEQGSLNSAEEGSGGKEGRDLLRMTNAFVNEALKSLDGGARDTHLLKHSLGVVNRYRMVLDSDIGANKGEFGLDGSDFGGYLEDSRLRIEDSYWMLKKLYGIRESMLESEFGSWYRDKERMVPGRLIRGLRNPVEVYGECSRPPAQLFAFYRDYYRPI